MKHYFSLILVILGVAYVFSPVDLFPDAIPFLGFFDDLSFVGLLMYYLRYKKLPDFSKFKISRRGSDERGFNSDRSERKETKDHHDVSGPGMDTEYTKSPHEILEVRPGASQEEIQKAYRKAVSKYHPDKMAHLGKDFQELAQKRFLQIQKAYEILKK